MRRFLFDWPIFGLGLILSLCGLVLVYSATWDPPSGTGFHASDIFVKQIAALGVALVAFYLARRIKWGLKPDTWLWFYVPVLLLLIAVLYFGQGHEVHGARRWINLGFFMLQPSEPAKIAWVLILAWMFSVDPGYLRRNYFLSLALLFSMVGLMMAQPDLGTSLVFVFCLAVVALFSQLPRKLLLSSAVAFILVAIPGFFLLKIYQQNRVLEMFGRQKWQVVETVRDGRFQITESKAARIDPERTHEVGDVFIGRANPTGVSWQATQSMIALGSGGLTGKGFLRGTQAKGGFVPEIESDFIFALVGEEFGFVGCMVLLLLFFLLIARVLALAHDVHTSYERYICYGVSAVLLFHVLVAAGMTMRIVPVAGVPLPFISQGGSSLITFWLLLALIESLYERSQGEFLQRRRYTAAPRLAR